MERGALLSWLSLRGPAEYVLCEYVEALTVQRNITVAIRSVSESAGGLERSGERRKPEKSRSSHDWINTHKGRDTAIPACAWATEQGKQGEVCLAERAHFCNL